MSACEFCKHGAGGHSNIGCGQCACSLTFSDVMDSKDNDWLGHEGYPRDMSEREAQIHASKLKARSMGSSSIKFGGFGSIRQTVFEAGDQMLVGDKVALRGKDGKVMRAKLGESFVGTVVDVDRQSGLVTVQMGGG